MNDPVDIIEKRIRLLKEVHADCTKEWLDLSKDERARQLAYQVMDCTQFAIMQLNMILDDL